MEKKLINILHLNNGAHRQYHCAYCGQELRWSTQSGWECPCGQRYEVITTGEVTHEDVDYSEDVFIKAVMEVFELGWEDIIGRCRRRDVVMAREIVADYLYNQKWLSLWRAGDVLGKRTNAAVYHLCRSFERDYAADRMFVFKLKEATDLADGTKNNKKG